MTEPARPPQHDGQRIARITLDEHSVLRRSPAIEDERAAAITDLLDDNSFTPLSGRTGPFHLHLAVEENRLIMEIRPVGDGDGVGDGVGDGPANGGAGAGTDGSSEAIVLPLAPFRRIVKDYFMVCDSYYKAVRAKSFAQVEAIDVGRRSLHDEGSRQLIDCLADKVALDHATARRLFTLLCVLHLRA